MAVIPWDEVNIYNSQYSVAEIDASIAAGFEAKTIAQSVRNDANAGRFNGSPGADGKNFTIKGYYASLADLQAAVPNPEPGDPYGIGNAYPYDVYVYDGVNSEWKNNGLLLGVKGETGTAFIPNVNENGDLSWSNDGGLPNPPTVNIKGIPGEPGKSGAGKIINMTLPKANWTGSEARWTQDISIAGYTVTTKTRIDVLASSDLLAQAMSDGFSLVIGNNSGSVKAYIVGNKPTVNLNVQLAASEAEVIT